jgi:hypothetical protein
MTSASSKRKLQLPLERCSSPATWPDGGAEFDQGSADGRLINKRGESGRAEGSLLA